MAVRTRALSIPEFLLTYVLDDDEHSHSGVHLRAEIERHRERAVTVESRRGVRTIRRCEVCPPDEGRPCKALRVLALPYARHPSYRREWWIAPPVADQGVADAATPDPV